MRAAFSVAHIFPARGKNAQRAIPPVICSREKISERHMREEEYRQRLQNLEEKFSWQEETVDQLSEILREQQQQLEPAPVQLQADNASF